MAAAKKITKIAKSKQVKIRSKTSSKIVDKKIITEGTEDKQKAPRKTKTVKSLPAGRQVKSAGGGLLAPAFDINGRSIGKVALPKEIFGQKPNEKLLAQAIRIYSVNQSVHAGSTKTRSQTRGGGRKPWRQKGTGRARAGSIRSPLWVGGGVAHGPKFRKVTLTLPKKMKRKALVSAFSLKAQEGSVKVITNIEKIQAKTKIIASLLKKLDLQGNCLLVISDKPVNNGQDVKLATRNIQRILVSRMANLNAFEIIKNRNILLSKEAIGVAK